MYHYMYLPLVGSVRCLENIRFMKIVVGNCLFFLNSSSLCVSFLYFPMNTCKYNWAICIIFLVQRFFFILILCNSRTEIAYTLWPDISRKDPKYFPKLYDAHELHPIMQTIQSCAAAGHIGNLFRKILLNKFKLLVCSRACSAVSATLISDKYA